MNNNRIEVIWAFGHENVLANHPTTLMFTKDKNLSKKGDCVVAVAADKSAGELDPQFKEQLRKPNAKLTVLIEANGLTEQVVASGSSNLILNHPRDIVIRKSSYISDRTLAINADKASIDLNRKFVKKIQNPKQKMKITLVIEG